MKYRYLKTRCKRNIKDFSHVKHCGGGKLECLSLPANNFLRIALASFI